MKINPKDLESLSPEEKRALLAQLLKKKAEAAAEPASSQKIPLQSREAAAFPLSFGQQRLWYLDQINRGSSVYNLPLLIHLKGQLNVTALEESLNKIIARHETLHTKFAIVEGEPMQTIFPALFLPLPVVDVSDQPIEARSLEVDRLANEAARQPFNLSEGPLLRAVLYRLGDESYSLLLVIHHIVADGWSYGLLIQELAAHYKALIKGEPSTLPPLPIQYVDFACWQREAFQGQALAEHLAYWKQQLAGEIAPLALPLDYPRPPIQTFRGQRERLDFPVELSTALKGLTRQEGVTMFMTLLAAFKLLLYRYTGQTDIVVGTPIAARNRVETERLIGIFLNTLALRTDLEADISFRELLSRVRKVALDAYKHQDIPFEALLIELKTERSLSHTPLFQVFFNLLPINKLQFQLPDVTADIPAPPEVGSIFDLTLYVNDQSEQIQLALVYNADLFTKARIVELLAQYQYLLEQIVAAPDKAISAYSLLTNTARQRLPDPTQLLPEPPYKLLSNCLKEWASRSPDHPAISQAHQRWSYGELLNVSQTLAELLLAQGLERGETVAVCGARSFGLISSIISVFLSGGVLLTLDQNLPSHRQQMMLKAAQAKRLLYVGPKRQEDQWMWESLEVTWIEPGTGGAVITGQNTAHAPISLPDLEPDDPAYIFFTSGTTGVPKGILGCHKGLAHFLSWQRQTFEVGPQDRSAQLTGLSFDVVLRDIFLPLTSGATLCLPTPEVTLAPAQILPWLERERISLLHTVPSLVQSWLIDLPSGVSLQHLRWIFSAGEPLTDTLVRQWRKAFPETGRLVNIYGPTETTLAKCYYLVPDEGLLPGIQPVGSTLPETQALVLKQDRQLCGLGEAGEIVIRTPFRSLGYINAPEEGAQRFVPNHFRDDPCDLLYYTGDLGRYRPDGLLEILGRLDHQVKIRGVRIEPGEISSVLNQHPLVHQAAIIAWEEGAGEKSLVAYVVPGQEEKPTISELSRFLRQRLPEYMLPSAYVLLERLPLTPNGKLDRRALPAPDQNRPELEATFVAPRTEVETQLAGIWATVLKLDRVGIHDNFFELGGHSLLATQIMSRIREVTQVDLPLRSLFEFPTIAGLSEQVEAALSVRQADGGQLIQPRSVEGPLPLSFTQQRLWFLDQFEPGKATFNSPGAARLKGPLNLPALEVAVNEILRRHSSLRTRFIMVEDQPRQIITPHRPFVLEVQDLSGLPAAEREAEAQRRVKEEAYLPFDLSENLLFRAQLLRLAEEEHILMVTMHHIVSDGWSFTIFGRELALLYEAFLKGVPSPLPELPIQYSDFALWQREWLQSGVLVDQLEYWKQQLRGKLPILELPTDYARPAFQTYREARQLGTLSPALSQALHQLCQQEGVTLFMSLLAAFKLLLQRYTDQEDMIVGSPIAGRNRAEIEGLIGFFINNLVLRTDLSGDISYRELLKRVRAVTLAAYGNQDVPFEMLLEELKPERNPSRTPLFQVFFNMFNFYTDAIQLPGVEAEALARPEIGSKFDLTLYVQEQGEQINLRLVYNADLFKPERMAEMIAQYETLLTQIVANPDQKLATFSLVTSQAKTYLPDPTEALNSAWLGPVHAYVSRQAQQRPQHLALVDSYGRWTYQELEIRSNQLAHYLQRAGIQPQEVVAIYGHRSANLVLAMLGILKAGAAFIILDPSYPAQRLINYIHLAAPKGWLQLEAAGTVPAALEEAVAALASGLRLKLPQTEGEIGNLLGDEPVSNPQVEVGPDDLAYISFTSGSTGKPKGIMGSHSPLSHFVEWHSQTFNFSELERFSMLSGLAHDPLLRDIFTPLRVGATLCIPEAEEISAPGRLALWLKQQEVTVTHLTPPMVQLLAETGGDQPVTLNGLRYAFFGGDILTKHHVAQLRQLAPSVTCVNFYGATETPQAMGYNLIADEVKLLDDEETTGSKERVNLGQGIADVQLLLLNEARQLAGIGEVGEIYIRTPYLSKGYLGDQSSTQERFIINPFTGATGDRLYKSGDLGRYLPDGSVEFLGRLDHQVKIRGFRVELGEVEAVLRQHPAVREAVVMVREDIPDDKRLVAYLLSAQEEQPASRELRNFARGLVPDYMAPSAFLFLETYPLTPNGKIDRKALPAPDQTRSDLEKFFVAPRTATEARLAQIWAELLHLERVSIEDNFFELGGHSLLATRIMSRIREVMQVELPLRTLFEFPTVAGLSEQVEAALGARQTSKIQPIQPRSVEGPLPLSFTQQRLWFLDQFEPGKAIYNNPGAVHLKGPLNIPALEAAVNEILRRHSGLRTKFIIVEGQPRQIITPHQPFVLEVYDLSQLPAAEREAEAQRRVKEEAYLPFDLSEDLLFRAQLLRLAEEAYIFMVTIHHIVSDGWSFTIFGRELALLYKAFMKGEPSPLPELPIQYSDFALWQREWLQGEVLVDQLEYWKQQLGGKLPVLELPLDYPRPPVQTYREARQLGMLSPTLIQTLRQLCQQEGITLFMSLLAAFKLLLQRYTGQEDIIVGSPIAGRNRAEIEGLIGFFINNLVLRTDLSGDISYRELLKRVRTMTLAAYANQDIPFEMLLEELKPEQDLSRTPIFQVFFNMFNFYRDNIELPGVEAEALVRPEVGSKFDLTLYLQEQGEQINLRLVYNADLFKPERMAEMIAQYEALLTQLVADPDQKMRHFSLVTEKAKTHLPNPSETLEAAWYGSIPATFSRQAARVPAHTAVADFYTRWSYQELEQGSNQLAHYLRAKGIQSQDVVAIYGHRSAALVWALLGILKAGAAFVILDPAYPTSRLIESLQIAQPRGWLQLEAANEPSEALEAFIGELNLCCRLELPYLTKTHPLLSGYPVDEPQVTIGPDDLAYIAFTSGSTGKPKGIMGSHSPLSHFLNWHSQTFNLTEADRFSMLSGLAHDPLLRDIFAPLWLGATLCIPVLEMIETPGQLAAWMGQQKVTVMHLTPPMAQILSGSYSDDHSSQNGNSPRLTQLRYAFFGGDLLTNRIVANLRPLAPMVTCVNFYGATETPQAMGYTIVSEPAGTGEQAKAVAGKESIPVGKGIETVQLLILNSTGQLAGVGEVGEIYIRTPYLSKGYKDDEHLTQERFLLNPFTDIPGDRLYKTGDLGRYLPDGQVEITGRDDHQVKIRGFRIELEEIEAVVTDHPAVRQAVVVAQEDEAGGKRLAAYVVLHPEQTLVTGELRLLLKQRLPDYMIPATFTTLAALPLTPNGKLDRLALPKPEVGQGRLEEGYMAPGTPLELAVAEVWQEALGLKQVGVYDNFFDLGGHSLLSIEVIARLEKKIGVRLRPADIRRQTLGQLAATCEERLQTAPPAQPEEPQEKPQGFFQKVFRSFKR